MDCVLVDLDVEQLFLDLNDSSITLECLKEVQNNSAEKFLLECERKREYMKTYIKAYKLTTTWKTANSRYEHSEKRREYLRRYLQAWQREFYSDEENRKRRNERRRELWAENSEEINRRRREKRLSNRETFLEKRKRYRDEHREKINAYQREHYAKRKKANASPL